MSVSSAALLLLTHETRTTDDRGGKDRDGTPSPDEKVTWVEAGQLRVRMGSASGTIDLIRTRRSPVDLTVEPVEESASLVLLETLGTPEREERSTEDFGFKHHLRSLALSFFGALVLLGIFGTLLGLAAFFFGVVLPFGLS